MADPLESCGKWFIPEPSLTAQLEREMDRRKAAQLGRDELNELADKLIVDWYQHEATVNLLLGRVRHLEVELVLASSKPVKKEIDPKFIDMARSFSQEQ
jgi:hypothetical protein